MGKNRSSCLGCFWAMGFAGIAGAVFLLVLSTIAFRFLSDLLLGGFDAGRQILVAAIATLGTLTPMMAGGLAGGLILVLFLGYMNRRQSQQWRLLEEIRREWVPLQKLLRRRKLRVYERELDTIRGQLLAERDRVEAIDALCSEELPRIQSRLEELAHLEGISQSAAEKAELRGLMNDMAANSDRLRGQLHGRAAFDAAKVRLAAKLQNLRLRLTDVDKSEKDMESILSGVDSVTFLADVFEAGNIPGDVTRRKVAE